MFLVWSGGEHAESAVLEKDSILTDWAERVICRFCNDTACLMLARDFFPRRRQADERTPLNGRPCVLKVTAYVARTVSITVAKSHACDPRLFGLHFVELDPASMAISAANNGVPFGSEEKFDLVTIFQKLFSVRHEAHRPSRGSLAAITPFNGALRIQERMV